MKRKTETQAKKAVLRYLKLRLERTRQNLDIGIFCPLPAGDEGCISGISGEACTRHLESTCWAAEYIRLLEILKELE